MKSEWEFQFEARGFRFEREHKYSANPKQPISLGDQPPKMIECLVRLVPKEVEPPPYVDQVGSLHVLVSGSMTDTRAFAYHVARMVADRITFQQGDFRILGGLVVCKRIPETPEEEAEFGDALYNVDLRLVEVLPTPAFDSAQIEQTPFEPNHLQLISQFNETKRDKSAIRQFLGFFRILESIYHVPNKKRPMKQTLLHCADLRRIHTELGVDGSYDELVPKLVDTRHKCAHLKLSEGFGYSPIDPAVEVEVKPFLPVIAAMAHRSIMQQSSSGK